MSETNTQLATSHKRAAHPDFVSTLSLEALRDRLPFPFPVPEGLPPSPKRHYRSQYGYRGPDDLADLAVWATLTLFEIALGLIDFSPLRDYLALGYYLHSAKGQVPSTPSPSSSASVCGGN